MSAEMWAIIGFGVVETTLIVVLSTILIVRLSNLRKYIRDMREERLGDGWITGLVS